MDKQPSINLPYKTEFKIYQHKEESKVLQENEANSEQTSQLSSNSDWIVIEEDSIYFKMPSFEVVSQNFKGFLKRKKDDYQKVAEKREEIGPWRVANRSLSQFQLMNVHQS